jgi:hypothetical protein
MIKPIKTRVKIPNPISKRTGLIGFFSTVEDPSESWAAEERLFVNAPGIGNPGLNSIFPMDAARTIIPIHAIDR